MSDYARSRYDKKEEIEIILTKASGGAEPQNDSSCNRVEGLNRGSGTNDTGIPTSEFMKSTVERLVVGVNRGSASVHHSHRFSSNMRGLVHHDVCKNLEPKNYGHGEKSFGRRRIKQKAVDLHAKAVVSETYSLRKLSEVPLELQKLGSSDIKSSDWNHFPMFEVNRKMDSILNPKRRSALGPVSLNVNMSASHMMALSAQEYMVHSHRISEENIHMHKPAGGIASHPEDPAGLSSDPFGQKLKGHLSDTISCSCSKDNDSSYCHIGEQHTSHYIANSKHELPLASSWKKFHCTVHEKDQSDVSALNNQKSRRSDGYKQQDAAGDIFRAPVLGTELCKEPTTSSYKSKHVRENFDGKAISALPYRQQHLKTQRTESAANLNLPMPVANTLTVTSKQLTHGKESAQKSTGSCKRKGPCLYEMLTTAPKSQSACPKNSPSSGNGIDVFMYGTNIGSHLFGTRNQSSARNETSYSDTLILSKSSAGAASSPEEKDYAYSNDAKTEHVATPFARRDSDSKEIESHNVNERHNVFSKATIASKQSCMPATGTTDLNLMLFQMSRMRNPISVGVAPPPVSAEPSDRWLKRLHVDVLDHEVPSSKRPKVGGNPSREDSSCLFGMALHCNRRCNEELIGRVKEGTVSYEGIRLQDDQRLHVPAKSMNYWIGRWCEGGTPVFHGDPVRRRQATKAEQASEVLGGQFPSIAAMAMMGRAMNIPRPCEHQKKGPFVVWKTE